MAGLNCKLGDGIDLELHKFTEFNGEPLNIETENYHWSEINEVFEISATDLIHFKLGKYLEESFLKILDFRIINDDQKYYRFMLDGVNKRENCDEFRRYPENTEYHINGLLYGIYLNVILPQTVFPDTEDKVKKLLDLASIDVNVLTEEQKKVKCKVLINTTETRTMTLEQVFRFKDEFMNENKHQEYQKIVDVGIEKHKELDKINVNNEVHFEGFLTYLYTCYRKIELKLEKCGYSLTEVKRDKNSTVISCYKNLQNAKNEFRNMDKTDFMKMYPIMKNLFYKYLDYLEFFIDHRLDMEEGDDLPMEWEDFSPWLEELNNWEIVKIHGGYTICNCGQTIFNPNEMTCNHPKHQEDVLIKQLPSDLRSIVYQLKKYEDDSTQIRETVTTIIDKHDDDDLMKELIQKMSNLNFQFDGDTKHLFNEFLK